MLLDAKCSPVAVKEVKLIFPVVGQSYLSSDEVFGTIEKELCKREVMIKPENYHIVFDRQGQLQKLGEKKNCSDQR